MPRPPTTTSCDDDDPNVDRPTLRRKIRTKTRKSSNTKIQDLDSTQSVVEAQIEKSFLRNVESQTDKHLKGLLDEPTVGEEVKFLRRMVHKLNVELSKCRNEESEILDGEPPPNWTHDLRRLAPLVLAFEEEVGKFIFLILILFCCF